MSNQKACICQCLLILPACSLLTNFNSKCNSCHYIIISVCKKIVQNFTGFFNQGHLFAEDIRDLIQLKHVICSQVLSLLAVICEEIVENCIKCGGLYFFEFTSCSAFLLSLLILCVYCTDVYETFGEDKVQRVVRKFFCKQTISCKCFKTTVELKGYTKLISISSLFKE